MTHYYPLTNPARLFYGIFSHRGETRRGNLLEIDLDGTFEIQQPEHLKAWADPEPQAVMDKCSHITEFGFSPDSEKNEYIQAVVSILFPLLGSETLEWVRSRLELHSPEDFDDEATRKKLTQFIKATPGPYTCEEMLKASTVQCEECASGNYSSPINIKDKPPIESEATGFWEVKINKQGIVTGRKAMYDDLYTKWCQDHEHITRSETGLIYIYDKSHWKYFTHNEVKAFVQNKMDPKPEDRHRREFLAYVKAEKVKDEDWFSRTTDGFINLKNGVFNIQTGELSSHSHKYGFVYELPYSYDPYAQAPRFEQFLDEITQGDKEVQSVLLEFMGYALANGECYAEKAMLLHGIGANGKSTFMDVLKVLAGAKNYSALSLSALNSDAKRYMMDGKLFNMGEETSINALNKSEVFKTLVTGGEVDIKKLYAQPYMIKNRAKLIFACNELPKSSDRSDGVYRRLILVPFNARFTDGQRDPMIRAKLSVELPGIFNMAVEGFRRLKENGYNFTDSKKIKESFEEYKLENDNILLWCQETLKFTDSNDNYCFKHEMFDNYKHMCEEDGSFVVPKNVFFKRIKEIYNQKALRETKLYHPMKQSRVRVIYGFKMEGGIDTDHPGVMR